MTTLTKEPKKTKEDEIIEILTAFKKGIPIEYRYSHILNDSSWVTIPKDKVNWNFEVFEYRIKKTPIEKFMFVEANPTLENAYNKPNLKLTFDPETEELISVEILK